MWSLAEEYIERRNACKVNFYCSWKHLKSMYSVTCLNRIPTAPNILSGLDRIRITQTRLFMKNFCIVVALIIKCAYYWMD